MAPPALVSTPVETARQWATALAPNGVGGWNFITQIYDSVAGGVPGEWVVVNLELDTNTRTEGPVDVFSVPFWNVASVNTVIVDTNQIRAANGRIFFPCKGTNIAYYDPADETVKFLPEIVDVVNGVNNIEIVQMVFDHTGMIYGATVVNAGFLPMIFSLDPVTLATTIIGYAGTPSTQVTYGYYLAVDVTVPDTIYIAVGQSPWELCSMNIATGVSTTLATATTVGPGTEHLEFQDRAGLGWEVTVTSNGVQTNYWVADGAITPYPGGGASPGARAQRDAIHQRAREPAHDRLVARSGHGALGAERRRRVHHGHIPGHVHLAGTDRVAHHAAVRGHPRQCSAVSRVLELRSGNADHHVVRGMAHRSEPARAPQ